MILDMVKMIHKTCLLFATHFNLVDYFIQVQFYIDSSISIYFCCMEISETLFPSFPTYSIDKGLYIETYKHDTAKHLHIGYRPRFYRCCEKSISKTNIDKK